MNPSVIALRKGMIAELETVNEYVKLMAECDDENSKNIFKSIIMEELIHVGEFEAGIDKLCPSQNDMIGRGKLEAENIIGPVMNPPMVNL